MSKNALFSWLEWSFLLALLVSLSILVADGLQGQHIGQDNALQVAKLQGQQPEVAAR